MSTVKGRSKKEEKTGRIKLIGSFPGDLDLFVIEGGKKRKSFHGKSSHILHLPTDTTGAGGLIIEFRSISRLKS